MSARGTELGFAPKCCDPFFNLISAGEWGENAISRFPRAGN